MAFESTLELPRFIVLAPNDNKDYLSYVHEGGDTDGFLKFSETQAVSPYAKFEVKISTSKGLVHIRNCQNNRYLERIQSEYWVAATSKIKDSCTLFKFIPVDHATEESKPTLDRCVSANHTEYDAKGNFSELFSHANSGRASQIQLTQIFLINLTKLNTHLLHITMSNSNGYK
ncbi:uncharacterized protein LOC120218044 [Hibiscus syriacus]|uniref:uncharacterized protein LOC120218044 n=1 Tax=Hibiscus syriacus TaxID=106335 RepID=UPI001924F43F|nr:uncharacterized protein LOC120218044 [Hibiscus syriacus]